MSIDSLPEIVIQECGSQTTLLIERSFRELGYRSVIMDPGKAEKWIAKYPPKLVVISGGRHSVGEEGAPVPSKGVLDLKRPDGKPVIVLGICYGQQWIAHELGGVVEAHPNQREYGKAIINVTEVEHPLFSGSTRSQQAWMNHGDSVVRMPRGFTALAYTENGTIAAMAREHIWCIQPHPEVTHTVYGKQMLQNLADMAGCERNWKPSSLVDDIQRWTLDQVGSTDRVFIGMSGGLDSTTLGAILSPVLGDRLDGITIDGFQFRENEIEEVRRHAEVARVNLTVVDVADEMERLIAHTIDAEEKRAGFRTGYGGPFVKTAVQRRARFFAQGTLAPDRIESGKTGGDLIKTHHNVGLELGGLKSIDPIGHLFKYEVRALAQELGLPRSVWNRQPFPGPGQFIRTIGIPATRKNVETSKWCDARVKEVLVKHDMYDGLSQLVPGYLGVKTTGIKGDKRAYGGALVVRAVTTLDFMTAEGVHFPEHIEDQIADEVLKHPDIVRVWFDPTNKGPGTIEFE